MLGQEKKLFTINEVSFFFFFFKMKILWCRWCHGWVIKAKCDHHMDGWQLCAVGFAPTWRLLQSQIMCTVRVHKSLESFYFYKFIETVLEFTQIKIYKGRQKKKDKKKLTSRMFKILYFCSMSELGGERRYGLAVRRLAGKPKGLSVRYRFGSAFSSKVVVCGHCPVICLSQLMKH